MGDTSYKVRYPEDVTTERIIDQALTHEDFWLPLWNLVRGRCGKDNVVFEDLGPFMRVILYPPPPHACMHYDYNVVLVVASPVQF